MAADAQPMLPGEAPAAYVPRKALLHVSPADIAMYINGRPFSMSLVQDGGTQYREPGDTGWSAYEDVAWKRGYIANTTTARAPGHFLPTSWPRMRSPAGCT